ncbi:DNA polymerase III subunit gamma and tau [Citricoccus sp. K5]|uniref:DNA polymerase III subunit gamma and tau n=1 Tax=Citricoccus sp. K5 TaxID=2653135 RepID=UPI0012F158FC|nr:DNA polymerase III subunit gamma and tau [Citricoccus sp. K5]VXC06783.1 DNA polymerase III subunits gamma and tau [Citricoccus sp. K5]
MTTALYRRYRPDSFEDIIGQEHVTVPLMTALSKDRVNHAYLFSGPRGCGKTTSARVLARCLNCAEGPTGRPCGVCDSCRELSTGGPGSLDVIEIDAASHGGVDDARDLRERATFAPVRDRYKIFIIDEAHMVTSAGFNALLKIVEEPPPHIKFIFATTEPDKVIGTVRSRTHHYPFRLVPPEPLMEYLERLCVQENMEVEPGVLSLVVRSGGGSVRDTLSVLDQLMAGAAQGAIGYDLAVNLLGYTPDALLDDVVDAVAAADSQTVFRVVDRVVQSGQDPRRFVEDLLERFRDLIIVKAMPDSASAVLHGMPEDQVRRLESQSAQLGHGEISRAADITNQALTEMVGATSPRLHLELLMARLMLPTTDATERGLAARLDRIERRLAYGGAPDSGENPAAHDAGPAAPGRPAPSAPVTSGAARTASAGANAGYSTDSHQQASQGAPAGGAGASGLSGAALARAAMKRGETSDQSAPAAQDVHAPCAEQQDERRAEQHVDQRGGQQVEQRGGQQGEQDVEQRNAPAADESAGTHAGPPSMPAAETPDRSAAPPAAGSTPAAPPATPTTQGGSASQVEMIRRAWPEILGYLEEHSRLVWMLVSQNASVAGFDGQLLTIGFSGDGPRDTVQRRGGDQVISEAVHSVLGIQPQLDLITGGSAPAGGSSPKAEGRPALAAPQPDAPRPDSAPAPEEPASAAVIGGEPSAEPAADPGPQGGVVAPTPPDAQVTAETSTAQAQAAHAKDEPGNVPDAVVDAQVGASSDAHVDAPVEADVDAGSEANADDESSLDPVEEAATGPGNPSEPEDLAADDVPVSDWDGSGGPYPSDDVPPPPYDDEPEPEDDGGYARQWGEDPTPAPVPAPMPAPAPAPLQAPTPAPVASGIPRPEPTAAPIPRPTPTAAPIPRPEPGFGGIPSFAKPEAEMMAAREATPVSAPAPAAETPHHRRSSRFQQMMEEYNQSQGGASAAGTAGGGAGGPGAPGVAGPASETSDGGGGATGNGAPGSVNWSDEVPSEDDITIEESGIAGRKVVERLLGGRFIEERMLDGSPLS